LCRSRSLTPSEETAAKELVRQAREQGPALTGPNGEERDSTNIREATAAALDHAARVRLLPRGYLGCALTGSDDIARPPRTLRSKMKPLMGSSNYGADLTRGKLLQRPAWRRHNTGLYVFQHLYNACRASSAGSTDWTGSSAHHAIGA